MNELALLDEIRLRKFYKKVLRTERASLIAYWPLWEASGSVANDISGNGRNGAYSGVTLGQPGIGDGRTCPLFDGTTSYVNVYSAALAAAFNGAEGTLLVWAKVANAGVWTDGIQRNMALFFVNASNYVAIYKSTANNRMEFAYVAGGTTELIVNTPHSPSAFVPYMLSWSKAAEEVKAFVAGIQLGTTQTALGVWAGALGSTSTLLGAGSLVPGQPFSGNLAHGALWSKALTAAQIASFKV